MFGMRVILVSLWSMMMTTMRSSSPTTATNNKNRWAVSATTPTTTTLTIKNCTYTSTGIESSSRRCTAATTAPASIFNVSKWGSVSGESIDLDFGPGRRYNCLSSGEGGGGGGATGACFSSSTSTAAAVADSTETAGGAGGNGDEAVIFMMAEEEEEDAAQEAVVLPGEINFITRGTNSLGEPNIFGSTNIDGEICDFSPDATGLNLIVQCKMASDYPPELDPPPPPQETNARKMTTIV